MRRFAQLLMLFFIVLQGEAFCLDLNTFSAPKVDGEMIIRFASGTKPTEMKVYVENKGGEIVRFFESSPSVLARFESDAALFLGLRESLDSEPLVSMMPNYHLEFFLKPTDAVYPRQYHHQVMNSEAAWDISTGSKKVKVAVIDTGVNYKHQDLEPNYYQNPAETGLDADGNDKSSNGIDDDGNGYVDDFRGWDFGDGDNDPMDDQGHGTHCAGNVGAKGDDGYGVTGVNWDVSIVGLKISAGKSAQKGMIAAAIEAIEYATKLGVDVISASWGGQIQGLPENDPLRDAIEAAGKKGILFVAAAGNAASSNDSSKAMFPASYLLDNIIAVGASTAKDELAQFSNYGVKSVDIMAPGDRVISTVFNMWGLEHGPMSGTSMAAPLVAGAAALLKSVKPGYSAIELKETLMATVDLLPSVKRSIKSGGRINLVKALED